MDNARRNITNGEVELQVDTEDILPTDQKFSNGWQYQDAQNEDIALAKTSVYLENIRTGEFSEIADNYLARNVQVKHFTSDTFESEMNDRAVVFSHMISKVVLFFEGILAGMCFLQFIILKLAQTTFSQQVFRVDQIIRIAAFMSTLGSIFVLLSSYRVYNQGAKKSTVTQLNELNKQYFGAIFSCIFYCLCWVFLNIAHKYAVLYNLNKVDIDNSWQKLQIVYMVFSLLGWLSSVISSNYFLNAL